jgi:hypothetical protein
MILKRLPVWLFVIGWLWASTPRLYSWLHPWITRWIENADLGMWNGGEWLSLIGSFVLTALYIAGVCALVEECFTKAQQETYRRISNALTLGLLMVVSWWGTQFLIRLLLQGVPDSLSFLIAAFTTTLLGVWILAPTPLPSSRILRGASLRPSKEVARKFKRKKAKGFMPWGAAVVEKRNEPLHFIAIGNTGAGKSTWFEIMMSHTLTRIGITPYYRAIVVDAKGNILPFLEALGLGVGTGGPLYVILNPLDLRSARWATGKDINTPGRAVEFARLVMPEIESEHRFFNQLGFALLTAVIISLQRAKGELWSFRDLINAFSTPLIAYALIKKWHPRPQDFEDFFKGNKGDRNDIFITVRSELDQYQIVAACWERAEREFSVSDWIRGEYVLVLGSDYEYPDALKKVNALLFTVIAARLKQLPDDPERRVWLYIDELIATGKLVAFEPLLQLGRSKAVCMVSSVLNIASFNEEFGENIAKSIWALSRHKAFFPMDSGSAKYVSEAIGNYECIQTTYTPQPEGNGQTPRSSGLSYKRTERPTLLPQELDERNLPLAGPAHGLTGYFVLPGEGIHRHTYTWQEITKMRPERLDDVVGYDRIDERFVSTIPTLWTAEELEQLKLGPSDLDGDPPRSTKQNQPRKPGDGSGNKPQRPIKKGRRNSFRE